MEKKEYSVLSIIAFICTLIPILSIVGIIIGIVDLSKKDKTKIHYPSIIAIVLGSVTIIVIVGAIILGLIASSKM